MTNENPSLRNKARDDMDSDGQGEQLLETIDAGRLTLPVHSISAVCGAMARNRPARPLPDGQADLFPSEHWQADLFTDA